MANGTIGTRSIAPTSRYVGTAIAISISIVSIAFLHFRYGLLVEVTTTSMLAPLAVGATLGSLVALLMRANDQRRAIAERLAIQSRELADLNENLESKVRDQTRQLVQAQKMETIGRLTSGIAHDFRNLLTPIMGLSTALHHELVETLDPEAREDLAHITKCANHATGFANQLLSLSKPSSEHYEEADLVEVLLGFEPLLRRFLRPEDHLEVSVPASPRWSPLGTQPLEQILLNLVLNARDAAGSAPVTIEIVVRSDEAKTICIEVTDDGPGMENNVRMHVFDDFFSTKGSGGNGLGLATVRTLLESVGGEAEVYSELGHGTTFALTLPRIDRGADSACQRAG